MKYSIDKIKIEFKYIKTSVRQKFLSSLELLEWSDSYYMSNSLTKCHHNFLIRSGDGTIYIGVEPNWNLKEDRTTSSVVLEYNPNKINPWWFKELLWLKSIPRHCVKVMTFDIAVDMEIPYRDVVMLKRDVREKFTKIGKREIETYYLGDVGHNHVKLYDKGKEQKMSVDWTRFEITCKKINSLAPTLESFEECIKVPTLYTQNYQLDIEYSSMSDLDRLAFTCILNDIQYLYSIRNYRTRKKMESYLSERLNSLSVDIRYMYDCYNKYIQYLYSDEISPF